MASSSSDSSHRWVATLIVLLLLFQAGNWAWKSYRYWQQQPALGSASTLQRKIARSMAYDTALLLADSFITSGDTATAATLLDSLSRQPTDRMFPIERQKLRRVQQRLDSARTAAAAARHR